MGDEMKAATKQDLLDFAAATREAMAAKNEEIAELEAKLAAARAERDGHQETINAICAELLSR